MYTATFYSHIPHNFLSQYSMCITDKGTIMALKTPPVKSFHCVVVKAVLTISSGDLSAFYPCIYFPDWSYWCQNDFCFYIYFIYIRSSVDYCFTAILFLGSSCTFLHPFPYPDRQKDRTHSWDSKCQGTQRPYPVLVLPGSQGWNQLFKSHFHK